MRTAHVDDIDIEYEVIGGGGEPVLLIHGSNLARGLVPVARALTLRAPSLRLVRYHRRGMAGSGGRGRPISVERQAADALGLLDTLGLSSSHLLGYSYGAVVALEAALSAPSRVRSLVLVEPTLTQVPSAGQFMAGMKPVMDLYAAGDPAGAVRATLAGLGGPGWLELLKPLGEDALDMALRDAELFYRAESPSLASWRLDGTRAAAVRSPMLSVTGTRSGTFFEEGRRLLHQHFTQCVDADIPEATHLLQLQEPDLIAAAAADFLAEHRFL